MRQDMVIKKIFFGILLFCATLTQGWAANECSGTSNFTFSTSGANTVFSDSISDNSFDSGDTKYYYFSVPSAGTVTFDRIDNANLTYRYSASSCPYGSVGSTLSDGDTLTFNSAEDFNLRIRAGSNNQRYNFTLTFVPAGPTLSNISVSVLSTTGTLTATPSANGVLYYVVTTSSTAPSVAQIKAGQTNTGATAPFYGNDNVTNGAVKSFNLSGLVRSTTYYGYFVLTDSGGTNSIVYSTGAFTTANNNVRNFQIAYQTNDFGNVKIVGNSVMVGGANNACPTDTARNNDITAVYANIDSLNTFNSSSADLSMPVGAIVKWAGLYWQGYGVDYNSTMKNVKFKSPNMSSYVSLASEDVKFNWVYFASDRYYYQGAIDVTNYVKNAGNGTYTVGNIATSTGRPNGGSFGAWSLVVVYQDLGDTLKNLTVFDGYQAISQSDSSKPDVYTSLPITLSGFLTPPRNSVSSTVYMFVGEGDLGATGDSVSMTNKNGTPSYLSDGLNPWNDIMNSSVTSSGAYVTSRNPSCRNTIGIDIDSFNVGTSGLGIIGNNQKSTTATFTSSGDGYFPGVAAFATQIYQPFIQITKQANTSGTLQPASTISYAAYMKNSGEEAASNITVFDDFTSNQLYDTSGELTNPAVYLSDVMDRNATKILKSIRLTDINGTTLNHCPAGVTGAGCVYSDADCGVDYIDNPETTATKIWCKIPTLEVNATINMTFSVDLATDAVAKTKNQNVNVTNVMSATYYNALTGEAIAIPATSNSSSAGLLYGKIGSFDAWETGLAKASARLYTKVTGNQFTLNVGTNAAFTGAVCAAVTNYDDDTILTGGGYQCQNYLTEYKPFSWTVSKAARKAKIKIKYKAYGTAASVNTASPNWSGWDDGSSSDVFAIRPPYLLVSATPSPVIVQKAGDDAKVVDINTSTPGYNQSPSRLTLNILEWLKIDGSTLGATPNTTGTLTLGGTDFDSLSGNTNGAIFVFSDVGRFKVDISDRNWSTDSGDVSSGDCLTTPTVFTAANTLNGGKYGCYVMLNPQSGIDLRFIPYKFMITNASLANASGGNFTYFSSDLNAQAATIPMTITAVNKDEIATANYASGLYEQAITLSSTGLSQDGYTPVSSISNGAVLGFDDGSKTLSMADANVIKFNFSRSTSIPLAPLSINGSNASVAVTDTDSVSGSAVPVGSASFLYGRVNMPNTSANSGDTVRAFAQVYATSSANLPTLATGTWVNAPGSTTWWVNSLHGSTLGGINATVVKTNSTLNNTTSLFSVGSPDISGGKFEFLLPSNLTDQQVLLHFDVPTYLWYGTNSYSYGTNSDCSQHPCGKVEIFGTDIKQWYGAGDKKGDKAIQTVPKGKRAPKVNW